VTTEAPSAMCSAPLPARPTCSQPADSCVPSPLTSVVPDAAGLEPHRQQAPDGGLGAAVHAELAGAAVADTHGLGALHDQAWARACHTQAAAVTLRGTQRYGRAGGDHPRPGDIDGGGGIDAEPFRVLARVVDRLVGTELVHGREGRRQGGGRDAKRNQQGSAQRRAAAHAGVGRAQKGGRGGGAMAHRAMDPVHDTPWMATQGNATRLRAVARSACRF
jgi:hypothetical protein